MKKIDQWVIYQVMTLAVGMLLGIPAAHGQAVRVLGTEGKAIEGAEVGWIKQGQTKGQISVTDADGVAKMPDRSHTGRWYVAVRAFGFQEHKDSLLGTEVREVRLEEINTALDDVVITGQYVPVKAANSVHEVRVIGREKIKSMGAQNLTDLLSNELNVRISQDNALGASMSLQGISGQNVKILVDGVPVIGRMNGSIDLSQINLNDVERVEIVKEPLAVSYGTDALAGTINIITTKPKAGEVTGSAKAYYESSGHYNTTAKVGIGNARNQFSLSGTRNYFDGWRADDPAFTYIHRAPADSMRFQDWKPKEQYFGAATYAHEFKNLRLGVTSRYFQERIINRGLPRAPYQETAFDDHYRTWRADQSIDLTGQLSQRTYLTGFAAFNYYQRIKNTYFRDLTTLSQTETTNFGDQDTSQYWALAARGTMGSAWKTPKLRHELGLDLRHEWGTGARITNGQQAIGDYAIFGSLEYRPVAGLTLKPAMRYAYNTVYNTPLLPSFHVKYATGKWNFRGSYALGYRAPGLKELYLEFYDINHSIGGNPDLRPERSNSYRVSSGWGTTKGKHSFKVDGSGFYNEIKDMISLSQIAGGAEYTYINIGEFKSIGVQVDGEWRRENLSLEAGASRTGRYNLYSELEDLPVFVYSTEARLNLGYRLPKQGLAMSLFYKYTGAMPGFMTTDDGSVVPLEIAAYHTMDASVIKRLWDGRATLTLGAKNLLNVTNVLGYVEGQAHGSAGSMMMVGYGRSYFASLEISLGGRNEKQ